MSRIRPEYLDASDHLIFREEPDEEEERKTRMTAKKGMRMTTNMAASQCKRVLTCRRGER
jgi:hypothetical protein